MEHGIRKIIKEIVFEQVRHTTFDIRLSRISRGTTLIEMIIYLGISAILIMGVGVVSASAIDAKSKTKAVGDVYFAATNVNAEIDQLVRGGTLLITPSWKSSSSTLVVVSGGVSTTSTSIYENGGTLYTKNGTSAPQALHGSEVKIGNLGFFAVGASTSSAVRITFGLSASTTGVWRELQFAETFTTTVALENYR